MFSKLLLFPARDARVGNHSILARSPIHSGTVRLMPGAPAGFCREGPSRFAVAFFKFRWVTEHKNLFCCSFVLESAHVDSFVEMRLAEQNVMVVPPKTTGMVLVVGRPFPPLSVGLWGEELLYVISPRRYPFYLAHTANF